MSSMKIATICDILTIVSKGRFNPLPDDKILDMTKLKAFADDS